MGWASGGSLMGDVLKVVLPELPAKRQLGVVKKLCVLFQDRDCDTLDELSDEWPVVRAALRSIDPELYEEDSK